MSSQVFISLPVNDLAKALAFYTRVGFTNNPQFSDDTTKCMVWSDTIFVMIMTRDKFNTFATRPIADTKKQIAGLYTLTVDNADKVHEIIYKGLEAGGFEPAQVQDLGFMTKGTIEDPDGHTWEIVYMDFSKFPAQ